jgi:hypothetical protein
MEEELYEVKVNVVFTVKTTNEDLLAQLKSGDKGLFYDDFIEKSAEEMANDFESENGVYPDVRIDYEESIED